MSHRNMPMDVPDAINHPPVIYTLSEKDLTRFWMKVHRSEGCWEWTGSLAKRGGYGQFKLGKTIVKAHRVSYYVATGEQPGRLFVCHRCDNPRCVNPDHLFAGTPRDNWEDCNIKGRAKQVSRKLSACDVELIRSSTEPGIVLARRYGVSNTLISNVRTRKTWTSCTIR